jgi:hypothetical protein
MGRRFWGRWPTSSLCGGVFFISKNRELGIDTIALGEQEFHCLRLQLRDLFQNIHNDIPPDSHWGGNEKSGRLVYLLVLLFTGQ